MTGEGGLYFQTSHLVPNYIDLFNTFSFTAYQNPVLGTGAIEMKT